MHYFYSGEIDNQSTFILSGQESHHAFHVLRLTAGERIILLNGRGESFDAEISAISKKGTELNILKRNKIEKPGDYYLHIAIAPVKSSDRFDIFLEKATEIGIDEITPVITQNSERRKLNVEKSKQTLIAAIKQSGNAYLPVMNELMTFDQFLSSNKNFEGDRLICHCQNGEKTEITKAVTQKQIMILIGAEGDFTIPEINAAVADHFVPVTLGKGRLRSETAGIYATAFIRTLFALR